MSNPNKNNDKSKKNKGQSQNKKTQNNNGGPKGANKKPHVSNLGLANVQPKPIYKTKDDNIILPKSDGINPSNQEITFSNNIKGKYSRRKIESISRVELPDSIYNEIEESSRGANLHELFNRPISKGDHFQFKSEKNWEGESKHLNQNHLFSLDFQKLGEHIACIPFHEIAGLKTTLFSGKQIASMNQNAEDFQKKYSIKQGFDLLPNVSEQSKKTEALLKNLIIDDLFTHKKTNEPIFENHTVQFTKEEHQLKSDVSDELDDLLKSVKCDILPTPYLSENTNQISAKISAPHKPNTPEKEDLEEWLDEYLGN